MYTKGKYKKSYNDFLVEVTNFDNNLGESTSHIVSFQLKRKHLRKLKKLLKESFKEDNLF